MKHNPPDSIYRELAKLDSHSVANAMESFGVRLRNEGFTGPGIARRTDLAGPMVGVALTLKVRSSDPPMKAGFYLDQPDWWERIEAADYPRVLIIQDVDTHPGRGALVGPVHGCIVRALGFTGVVTSGAMRGARKLGAIGLHAFSGNVSPSHAYSHVLEIGGPVELAGLRIATGDVIHGDQDGIVSVPAELAAKIPEVARRFMERERAICEFCERPGFSPGGLKAFVRAEPGSR
jgi:regulator of RNase E activity RraA